MDKPEFYKNLGPFTLDQIKVFMGATLNCKDDKYLVKNFNNLETSNDSDVTFVYDNSDFDLNTIKAETIIVSKKNYKLILMKTADPRDDDHPIREYASGVPLACYRRHCLR